MKRIISTALVAALFLAMLAGTAPNRTPKNPGTVAVPQVTVPPTTGWPEHEAAGVRFQTPPGTTVDALTIRMPSGVDVVFDAVTGERTEIARERAWYVERADGFVGFMHDAPDALIALRDDKSTGRFCEVTACSGEPHLCTRAGISFDGKKKLTYRECGDVVAIARSIHR